MTLRLKWGIIGASKIANDFCIALRSKFTSTEHDIVAIASRNKSNAESFAQKFEIKAAYGSYEDLANDPDVEVVYVTLLNPQHYEICKKLIVKYGKHIVCEKPLAMNAKQTEEIFEYAEKHSVFIMEGLWSRFFPVYRHFSRLMQYKSFGDIKEAYVKHGFNGCESDRIIHKDLGGGIVLDIGCYAIQLVLFVFHEMPSNIKATGKLNSEGVDLYFEAELQFSGGRKASIICSGLENLENQATIITTKGPVCIPSYWCPTKYMALAAWHEFNLPNTNDHQLNYTNSLGLKYEADEVAKCIRSGKLYSDFVPPADSMMIAKIQDEIRRQIGVEYDCD